MENKEIFKNSELIPLLIKYVKVNKVVFPIEKVKYLSNAEVIDVLKNCIDKEEIYNPNYEMVKNITLLDDNDLKDIYPLIKESMEKINYDYMRDIKDLVNNVKSRKKGKKYSFEEHCAMYTVHLRIKVTLVYFVLFLSFLHSMQHHVWMHSMPAE